MVQDGGVCTHELATLSVLMGLFYPVWASKQGRRIMQKMQWMVCMHLRYDMNVVRRSTPKSQPRFVYTQEGSKREDEEGNHG